MVVAYDPCPDWINSSEYKANLKRLRSSAEARKEMFRNIGLFDDDGNVAAPYKDVFSESP